MSDLEAYPQDIKADLPAYETPAPPKAKFSRTKKIACAAVGLYLVAFGGYLTSQHVDVGSFASKAMRAHGHHHGMKGHGLPHYVPHQQVRADIAEDRIGVPLLLEIEVLDKATSKPVENLAIDVWHADAAGAYSGNFKQMSKHQKGPHSEHDGPRKTKGEKHDGPRKTKGEKHDGPRKSKGEKHEDEVDHREAKGEKSSEDSHPHHAEEDAESESRKPSKHHKGDAPADEESRDVEPSDEDEHRRPHHAEEEKDDDEHHGPHSRKGGKDDKHHGPPEGMKKHGKHGKHEEHKKHNCTESLVDLLRPTEKSLNSEWLRGVQETDAEGRVTFSTIFPGADEHRAPHIHFKVRPAGEEIKSHKAHHGRHAPSFKAGEFIFDNELVSQVLSLPEYSHSYPVAAASEDSHKFRHAESVDEVVYIQEGSLQSGLKAKMTIYVDAPVSKRDEFTDSETESA